VDFLAIIIARKYPGKIRINKFFIKLIFAGKFKSILCDFETDKIDFKTAKEKLLKLIQKK